MTDIAHRIAIARAQATARTRADIDRSIVICPSCHAIGGATLSITRDASGTTLSCSRCGRSTTYHGPH